MTVAPFATRFCPSGGKFAGKFKQIKMFWWRRSILFHAILETVS